MCHIDPRKVSAVNFCGLVGRKYNQTDNETLTCEKASLNVVVARGLVQSVDRFCPLSVAVIRYHDLSSV